MKVPTYTAQVERQAGGTGGMLTAQVSPRAMTAGAEVVQRIGESLVDFGFERLKTTPTGSSTGFRGGACDGCRDSDHC